MSVTAGAALRRATERLRAAGIEAPAREARLLLGLAMGLPDGAVPDPGAAIDVGRFEFLLARRAAREPLALIRGTQGFWTLDLKVSAATLIPRPDSETLIRAALAALPDRTAVRRVLDLGTGTGALLLAALAEYPHAWGIGVDVVPEAVVLAAENARRVALAGRAMFVVGCWAASLAGQFDLILTNPPYIESCGIGGLAPEVAAHEPRSALDGGTGGLQAYRDVIPDLPRLLTPDGVAVLELGFGQVEAVGALAAQQGLRRVALHPDYGGIARALVLGHRRS
jgi:release factor glutamine methyltransferase